MRYVLFIIIMTSLAGCAIATKTDATATSVQDLTAKPRTQKDLAIDEANISDRDCRHTENSFRCVRYEKNYDSDTITVTLTGIHPFFGQKTAVRLYGIDSPEMKGRTACEKQKAREGQLYVQQLLQKAKRIDLIDVGREKYGRILATVIFDGQNLNELLVIKKLAVRYFGDRKQEIDWCKEPK